MKKFLPFLLLFLFEITITNAQEQQNKNPKRIYITKFIGQDKAPIIDGKIDDAAWNIVDWDDNFIENDPDENTEPTFQTKFKIVYDAKYLYVGIRAFDDEPDKIEKGYLEEMVLTVSGSV